MILNQYILGDSTGFVVTLQPEGTSMKQILNISDNAKTVKSEKKGFLTGILYLAPGSLSGRNVCPFASPGCLEACLNGAGRGAMNIIQKARVNKTRRFFEDREAFMDDLVYSIEALIRKAKRMGLIPSVRLNGTSDIPWEAYNVTVGSLGYRNIFEAFRDVQFYDYTKTPKRMNLRIPNYHLTFSRSETNDLISREMATNGKTVAVVFSKIPTHWGGRPTVDGDEHDARFLDHKGVIVALKAKGPAKRDTSGFVVIA
jgi:hypothetical protein